MKKQKLFLLGILFAIVAISCSKKETVDPPVVMTTYSVDYKLELTGDYTDLIVTYYETGSVKKVLTSIVSPWEIKLDNFVKGDSVYFDVVLTSVPNKQFTMIPMVTITGRNGSLVTPSMGEFMGTLDFIAMSHNSNGSYVIGE